MRGYAADALPPAERRFQYGSDSTAEISVLLPNVRSGPRLILRNATSPADRARGHQNRGGAGNGSRDEVMVR